MLSLVVCLCVVDAVVYYLLIVWNWREVFAHPIAGWVWAFIVRKCSKYIFWFDAGFCEVIYALTPRTLMFTYTWSDYVQIVGIYDIT